SDRDWSSDVCSSDLGAIEGPIRIPLDSSLCLFNVLALLGISSKSLKLQVVLFSIPPPLPMSFISKITKPFLHAFSAATTTFFSRSEERRVGKVWCFR